MKAPAALLRREGTTRDGRAFLIRPSVADDADALVEVRDSIAAEGGLIAARPGERSAIEERLALAGLLSQGGLSLTLEVDQAIAGHLVARRLPGTHGADTAEIAIAVRNSARGQGLGRRLMETAIDWGRAVRCGRLMLGVFHTNLPALGLYRSLGFVEDEKLREVLALPDGGRDLVLMSLRL